MKSLTKFTLILTVLLLAQASSACTVFSAAKGDAVFAAANKDWDNTNTRVLVVPPADGNYGIIYFGYKVSQGFQNSGGVNDQGLWYDGASLPERTDIKNHFGKPTITGELCEKALRECSTVEQVIEMYKKFYTPHWQGHSMWADKHGASVVIEYGDNDVVFTHRDNDFQVMTNFYLSDVENRRWNNCYRFNVATQLLGEVNEYSVASLSPILDAVHQEGTTPTVYSIIYDLKNDQVFIFNFHNFQEYAHLQISEEMSKGARMYTMPELFHQTKLCTPEPASQNSADEVMFTWMGDGDVYTVMCSPDSTFPKDQTLYATSRRQETQYTTLPIVMLVFLLIFTRKQKAVLFFLLLFATLAACGLNTITSPYSDSKIEHQATIKNLQSNTHYFWKVRTTGREGVVNESKTCSFHTI